MAKETLCERKKREKYEKQIEETKKAKTEQQIWKVMVNREKRINKEIKKEKKEKNTLKDYWKEQKNK